MNDPGSDVGDWSPKPQGEPRTVLDEVMKPWWRSDQRDEKEGGAKTAEEEGPRRPHLTTSAPLLPDGAEKFDEEAAAQEEFGGVSRRRKFDGEATAQRSLTRRLRRREVRRGGCGAGVV